MKGSARKAGGQSFKKSRILLNNHGQLTQQLNPPIESWALSAIPGAPNAVLQNTRCPNGCAPIAGAPNAECRKCLGAPMAVPQTTVLLWLCSNCGAPRSGCQLQYR